MKFSVIACVFLIFLFALPLQAAPTAPLPLHEFGSLPIAHAGRIKPLSVFAREQLEYYSGKSEWQKKPATHWLATAIFTPQKLENEPLILVESQPLRESLALSDRAGFRYPLSELRTQMQARLRDVLESVIRIQQEKPATKLQEQTAELYAKIGQFQQLQESFSFFLPLPNAPSQTLEDLRELGAPKVAKFPFETQRLMQQVEERGRLSTALAIIPTQWKKQQDWYSPWALRFNGLSSPQTAEYLATWQQLATAYRALDEQKWNIATTRAKTEILALGGAAYQPFKLTLEEWYYKLSFLSVAVVCYGLFILLALWFSTYRWPYFALLAGVAFHSLALLVRMIILGRPPVSNLYESLLFVSLLIAMAGAFQPRKTIAAAIAAMAAFMLLISQSLLAGQEHLPVVMAVLNTNFWLGTHVICITAGYAAAVLAGLSAHYFLWSGGEPRKLHGIALIALLLTAVGTLLGGIWADQSWGRFWGWDPKENGAMLIVLWLVWLIHGRLAGQLSTKWYLAGMCYLNVIVALAWFGVNLLSVGLHSYGFTSGTAWALFGFIGLQTLVITWLALRKPPHAS